MKLKNDNFAVLGRAGLDLYPEPAGTEIEHATHFMAALGGSSGNIAAGLTRLGAKVQLITRVSDDAVGRYTIAECQRYGIDTGYVALQRGEQRNTLALSETRIDQPQTVIYRNNAADFMLCEDDVATVDWSACGALIFTGTSLAVDPSRRATMAAIEKARNAGCAVLFDIDYRAYSWASLEEAAKICGEAARQCDIVIGNDDEFGVLAGGHEKGRAFAQDLARSEASHTRICVYKMGAEGSVTFDGDDAFETGIFPVTAIKPTGAGDAFMAGFAYSLSKGASLRDCVLRGSAGAAMVVTRVGCAPAMPTQTELHDFMSAPTTTA